MRIGFTGDFHLGFTTGKRKGEDFRQAREALKTLLDRDVDLIVVLGDIFDTPVPRPEALRDAARIFGMAKKKNSDIELIGVGRPTPEFDGTPVIAIHGTHERRIKGEINPVELLEHMNFVVYLHNSGVLAKKDVDVGLYGVGGVPESYAKKIFRSLDVKPFGTYSFFLFHQNLRPYVPVKDSLELSDLPLGFNYYVDGHIHTGRLQKNLLITGSTVVTQMKKGEDRKFVWIWENGKFEPIEIKTRPFVIIEVDAGGRTPSELTVELDRLIESKLSQLEDPLIKVIVKGKLAKGFKPSDFSYRPKNGLVYVDKKLEGSVLSEMKLDKISVDEIAISAFKKVLEVRGLQVDAAQLYSALLRKDYELIWKLLQEESE